MSKTTKFLVYLFIIVYFVSIVGSQETWDYNKDESYKNPDFLRYSDAAKWEAKRVDWSNPVVFENPGIYKRNDIYSNPQVYTNPAFYKNLPEDKYGMLDYKQVQYDKIEDHSKIAASKYLGDLGCRSCFLRKEVRECVASSGPLPVCKTTSKLPPDTLKFSKDGIRHKGGDYVSIPGTYADAYVLFKVTPEGIIISPSKKHVLSIPETDTVTLQAFKNKVAYKGKEIELDYGRFFFRNGEMHVQKGRLGDVYGAEMFSFATDIKLFFDGEEHSECKCTYVSLDKDKKTIVSGVAEFNSQSIKFGADNQFVKIQGPLEIRQQFGTITFQNRGDKGLIPEINMKFDPRLQYGLKYHTPNVIRNGDAEIQVFGRGDITDVKVVTLGDDEKPIERKSNPLVLAIEDNNGKSILGTEEKPQKIIFGENNEFAALDYQTIASLEPTKLYFRSADDVKTELDRAKVAGNRIKELQDAAKAKWGNPGMRIFGYLDDFREAQIVRALRNGCGKAGMSLDFCTATAFQEGLNLHIDQRYYDNPKSEVSGFGHLGMDYFAVEADTLKKGGYLRKDFEEYTPEPPFKNSESNQIVYTANFKDVDVALEAFGARLKYTRDLVLRDAAKFGYKLDNDQVDYWTYVYYNCGPACKTQKLQNGPQIPPQPGKISAGDPVGNSKRVLATRDLIRKAGVFDRTLSQQMAKK